MEETYFWFCDHVLNSFPKFYNSLLWSCDSADLDIPSGSNWTDPFSTGTKFKRYFLTKVSLQEDSDICLIVFFLKQISEKSWIEMSQTPWFWQVKDPSLVLPTWTNVVIILCSFVMQHYVASVFNEVIYALHSLQNLNYCEVGHYQ
jgi:hypothetical protein